MRTCCSDLVVCSDLMSCSDVMIWEGGILNYGHVTHGGMTRMMVTRSAVCVSGRAPGSGDS